MNHSYHQFVKALSGQPSPSLFLDLSALGKNIKWAIDNASTKKIRIATKSIRSLEILKRILESHEVFQGLMTYTLEEALWLREMGFKDILMGYPTMDITGLKSLSQAPQGIVLMVDRIEHLSLLENIARQAKCTFEICVDIDLSLDLPGLRFGVYRSQIHRERDLSSFLDHLKDCSQLRLVGVMGYEAQIAGVIDKKSPLLRGLKSMSLTQLQARRQKMIEMIQARGHALRIINGGGTGSLKHTVQEKVITEVTVGSGFYAPVLFDHYQDFDLTPALFFTSPIVRQPAKDIFTILGGGYIASGSTDEIKQPQPYLPSGLKLLKHEGAGEVQTPLKYSGKLELKLGDLIILRHAKAAEICERFHHIHLIQDEKLIKTVTTYRGEGKCFL